MQKGKLQRLKPLGRRLPFVVRVGLAVPECEFMERLLRTEFCCVYNRAYSSKWAEGRFVCDLPGPGLLGAAESAVFHRFHYCRWRAMRLLRKVRRHPLSVRLAHDIMSWERLALGARNAILVANLGLVYVRIRKDQPRPMPVPDDPLYPAAVNQLICAIDHFDPSRGIRFSTYAHPSLYRGVVRERTKLGKQPQREAPLDAVPESAAADDHTPTKLAVSDLERILETNTADLTRNEQRVLRYRYGLGTEKPQTLKQVGERISISVQRVSQIQHRALAKLREVWEGGDA